MDVPDLITEATILLKATCDDCGHQSVAHRPSDRACLACNRSGGPCAVVIAVDVPIPTPAFARVQADFRVDGTDEANQPDIGIRHDGWRGDLEIGPDGEVVRQSDALSSFIEGELDRLFELRLERSRKGETVKNVGAYDEPKEPTKEERDRAYLGQSVSELMKHPRSNSGSKSGGGSKGGSKNKKGGGPNRESGGSGLGPMLPAETKRLTIAVTRGEYAYYSTTDEEQSVLKCGGIAYLNGKPPPPMAVGTATHNLVTYVDARYHNLFRLIPGLAHSYLQHHAIVHGRERYRHVREVAALAEEVAKNGA